MLARKTSRRLARERIAGLRSISPQAASRIRLVSGDLSMPDLFDAGVRDRLRAECRGVVHCAVDRRTDAARGTLFDVNVGATRALLALAEELTSGAHRFVHVSDTAVSGDARGIWMEDQLFEGQAFADPVTESRFLAERHVRRAAVPAAIVRTVLPVGPRPGPPDPVTKLLARAQATANSPLPGFLRRFFLVPGGSRRVHALPVDHVADVVAACWSDDRVPGRTLQVADPFAPTLREWLARLSEVLGLGRPGPDAPPAIGLLEPRFPAASVVYDTSNADALMRRAGLTRPDWREGIEAFVGSLLAG